MRRANAGGQQRHDVGVHQLAHLVRVYVEAFEQLLAQLVAGKEHLHGHCAMLIRARASAATLKHTLHGAPEAAAAQHRLGVDLQICLWVHDDKAPRGRLVFPARGVVPVRPLHQVFVIRSRHRHGGFQPGARARCESAAANSRLGRPAHARPAPALRPGHTHAHAKSGRNSMCRGVPLGERARGHPTPYRQWSLPQEATVKPPDYASGRDPSVLLRRSKRRFKSHCQHSAPLGVRVSPFQRPSVLPARAEQALHPLTARSLAPSPTVRRTVSAQMASHQPWVEK